MSGHTSRPGLGYGGVAMSGTLIQLPSPPSFTYSLFPERFPHSPTDDTTMLLMIRLTKKKKREREIFDTLRGPKSRAFSTKSNKIL